MTSSSSLLTAESISKSFGSQWVLRHVTFDVRAGEVHTLMGENGAGKSTLMKILAGVHQTDEGLVRLLGEPIELRNPRDAVRHGIALIHQEPQTFPDLSVAESIFLGRQVPLTPFRTIDWRAMNARATDLLCDLGVRMDPTRRVRGASIADQQMIELAAALSQDAKVLLMDEPTAALTPSEVDNLFAVVHRLKAKGVAVVFISHRLPEVFEVSDRITVLRDGDLVGSRTKTETDQREIVHLMVGRELDLVHHERAGVQDQIRLELQGLSLPGKFEDISFQVRAGEIVGLTGLVGAGRTEVAEAIFGISPARQGEVLIDGTPARIRTVQHALDRGVAYVPEDRQRNGLVLPLSIRENTSLANLSSVSNLGVLKQQREAEMVQEWRERLSTKFVDPAQPVQSLSGGNQQKVVLSKWLSRGPEILVVDEPTRGVDIGAKSEVHRLLTELANQGKAILLISSDLPEVLALSDRVLVMRGGMLVQEFANQDLSQEAVMEAATGIGSVSSSRIETKRRSPLERYRDLGTIGLLLAILLGAALIEPRILARDSLLSIALFIPLILIMAMGQMMAIIARHIDLSVGAVLGCSAMVAGGFFVRDPSFSAPLAFLIATGVGLLMGSLNGFLVARMKVPSIVTTLGTLSAFRGLIYLVSGGRQISPSDVPDALRSLAQAGPVFPWIVWISLAIAGATAWWLRSTLDGRYVFALGSNPETAALRGLPVRRTTFLIFALTGALSGFCGLLFAARFGTVNPNSVGKSMELLVISSVVLGGTAVNGGVGSVRGTLLGCLMIAILNVALTMMRVTELWQLVVYGAAILLATALDSAIRRRGEAA